MPKNFRGIASLLSIKNKFKRPYRSQLAREPCSSKSWDSMKISSEPRTLDASKGSNGRHCQWPKPSRAHKESEAATGQPSMHGVGSFWDGWALGNPSWGREMASSRSRGPVEMVYHTQPSPALSKFPFFFSFNPVSDEGRSPCSG